MKGISIAAIGIVLLCTVLLCSSTVSPGSVSVFGISAVGTTATEKPVFIGGEGSDAIKFPVITCDQSAAFTASAAATTLLLNGVASRNIWICAITVSMDVTGTFSLTSGTGGSCAGGSTQTLITPMTLVQGLPLSFGSGIGSVAHTVTQANNVCAVTTGVMAAAHGVMVFATLP